MIIAIASITGILVIAAFALNMMADDEARKSRELLEEIEQIQNRHR